MQRKLLTSGNTFKRTDGRGGRNGVVYGRARREKTQVLFRHDYSGGRKKITAYIANFENAVIELDESKKKLRDSMQNWLRVFKFPSVEQTTYDRSECSANHQVYPLSTTK